jgi:hypothetical protein
MSEERKMIYLCLAYMSGGGWEQKKPNPTLP